MNINNVRKRMSDVLKVDSINSTEADFLATHVPFREIFVKHGINGTGGTFHISETNLFNKLYGDSSTDNKHQFIIVEGSSGSGKSHFIRWLYAQMRRTSSEHDDVVMLIRRSDNTLKGTIKQLLNIEEIKNIKNKDAYERLVKANQTISEQKFKDSIYSRFDVEIKNDEDHSGLNSVQWKNLRALLNNADFEEKMLLAGGPIDRIYRKVSSEHGGNCDVVALFSKDDFILDTDFGEKLQNDGADRKAIKMANSLIPDNDGECDAAVIADYMNLWVDNVIQGCAGIEPGDFQQIFKEIRRELYNQGKNLVLLIEDITSFTGINQELLNALVTEHTGMNEDDKLCRLMSVVGTTTEYYKQFRDNYKDRITTQITIEDGAIGSNTDDLVQFVAKYLNTMSLSSAEIEDWYNSGEFESTYPVHICDTAQNWESYSLGKDKINIYPFTKLAIINLYNGMDTHKTPRYIIRDIIEPAVNEILDNKSLFPSFIGRQNNGLTPTTATRIVSIVSSLQIKEEFRESYQERVRAFVAFWGDGRLDSTAEEIGSIPRYMFDEFGLSEFSNAIQGATQPNLPSFPHGEEPPVIPHANPFINKLPAYNQYMTMVNDWFFNKKPFVNDKNNIRDGICTFIFESLNWQSLGVPNIEKNEFSNSIYKLIGIKRQNKAIDKSLVILEESQETYDLLMVFGRWFYLGDKSWNYFEAIDDIAVSDDIFTATSWLEKHKLEFVNTIRERDDDSIPEYVIAAMQVYVYASILNGDCNLEKLENIEADYFLRNLSKDQKSNSHCGEWESANEKAYRFSVSSVELIRNYFNLQQGNGFSKYTINYTLLKKADAQLRQSEFRAVNSGECSSKVKSRNEQIKNAENIYNNLTKVASKEYTFQFEYLKKVLEYFNYDDDDEVEESELRSLFDDMTEFYNECDKKNISVESRTGQIKKLKEKSESIVSSLKDIQKGYDEKDTFNTLLRFSKGHFEYVKEFCDILDATNNDIDKITKHLVRERDKLKEKCIALGKIDSRFDSFKNQFYDLLKETEVIPC